MRKHIPVTAQRLEDIGNRVSDIMQKTEEAKGTLMVIDTILEEVEDHVDSNILWSLRNAIRNIESANKDAFDVVDEIEQFEEIK